MSAIELKRSPRQGSCILILPRTQIFQRQFVVPTNQARDIERILAYRIPLETPFLSGEVTWTWRVVRAQSSGDFVIRVLLVENRGLKRYLSERDIKSDIRGILVEDEFLSLWQSNSQVSDLEEIHLYHQQDRLLAMLVHKGECIRSCAVSGSEKKEASQLIGGLWGEESDDIPKHNEVLIRVQEGISLVAPPFGGIVSPELDNPLSDDTLELFPLRAGGWLMSPKAVGNRKLASRVQQAAHSNLLPESWRARATGRRRFEQMLIVAAACCILALIFSFWIGHLTQETENTRKAWDRSRSRLSSELERVQAAQMLITNVETTSDRSRNILAVWERVVASVPRGVTLSGMTHHERNRLTIHGSAQDRAGVVALMEKLRADESALFVKVILGGLEERSKSQIFSIVAELRAGEKPIEP